MEFDKQLFLSEIGRRKEYIDSCLKDYLEKEDAYPPVIHQAMHYAVFNGGKRLRPIMVLEGARLAGDRAEQVVPAACAMEMIHSYSLVHDDLPAMDNDDFRRGKPTCHKVFGEDMAILTGDALLTAAFELIARCVTRGVAPQVVLQVITEVAQAAGSRGMIGGQVVDLESEGKSIDYDTLKILHSLKTGQLFLASLRTGALLGGMEKGDLDALTEYAYHFGLAFQITDDLLDVRGDEQMIGKPVGSDARNGKTTYVTLFGIEKAESLARKSVQACLESLSVFDNKADFLRNLARFTLERDS
ncbi:polyprenyl synthetase family protein [Syntrophomonas erecta]